MVDAFRNRQEETGENDSRQALSDGVGLLSSPVCSEARSALLSA